MTATLHADGIAKRFAAAEPVLRDVALTVTPGTLTVVRAGAGAGKTTLVRCLAGTYRSDGGTVRLVADDGEVAVDAADARTVAWLRRGHLGCEDGRLIAAPREPARDAAARALERTGVAAEDAAARAGALLDALGLAELASTPVGLLPAHARRAVAVGRRLLAPPAVLLLDEPTAGLAAPAAAHVVELLDAARRRGTALLATGAPGGALDDTADHTLDLTDGAIA
ncbi:MAG TPA: ATP-binding cassette domain-containing protein [Capillimicrobium sp.]|nr:ATP-binding cassette domain-containing protein [Capillimicrobium sp.]